MYLCGATSRLQALRHSVASTLTSVTCRWNVVIPQGVSGHTLLCVGVHGNVHMISFGFYFLLWLEIINIYLIVENFLERMPLVHG